MTWVIADGTPQIIRSDPGSSSASASASTLRTTSTSHPPHASGTKISSTEKSKLSDVDASDRDNSAAENCAPAHDTRSARFRCSTITPLGLARRPRRVDHVGHVPARRRRPTAGGTVGRRPVRPPRQ